MRFPTRVNATEPDPSLSRVVDWTKGRLAPQWNRSVFRWSSASMETGSVSGAQQHPGSHAAHVLPARADTPSNTRTSRWTFPLA